MRFIYGLIRLTGSNKMLNKSYCCSQKKWSPTIQLKYLFELKMAKRGLNELNSIYYRIHNQSNFLLQILSYIGKSIFISVKDILINYADPRYNSNNIFIFFCINPTTIIHSFVYYFVYFFEIKIYFIRNFPFVVQFQQEN